MFRKRALILFFIFLGIFTCLMLRMFYLQFFSSESLSKAASAQRTISSSLEKPRGNIVDRNEIPFTNRVKRYTIVLKPLYLKDDIKNITKICEILQVDIDKIIKQLEDKSQPVLVDTDEEKKNQLIALKIEGVSVVYSLKRYDSSSLAKHILGYLSKKDQVGQTGIEKFYEDVLKENTNNTVGIITDAKNNLVKGLGYRISKEPAEVGMLNVKLTLDYHIQKIVEDVMAKNGITGAVVVEDVNNGDIIAMASKPDYEQNSIENYLQSPGNELFNRAVASYNIGSVFKIIDAAAMLETPGFTYGKDICTGSVTVGGNIFKCSSFDKGGHGEVDIDQAFAQSCNSYFINMCIKLGYKKLVNMAEIFGMGNITGIKEQGISETKGILPSTEGYFSNGDIANLSIGQGVVMISPIQAADMVATVANGGIKNRVNIVDSIVDQDGKKVREVRTKEGRRIISKVTAEKIKEMMEAVTDYGTGTAAKLDQYGGTAGKTGSAETGKKDIVHAWFAGYFPRSQPKYSIAVLVENGQYGGKAAAPIFAEIAAEIMKKGY